MPSPRGKAGPKPEDEGGGHQQKTCDGAPSGRSALSGTANDGENGEAEQRGNGGDGQHRALSRPPAFVFFQRRHVLKSKFKGEGFVAKLFVVKP